MTCNIETHLCLCLENPDPPAHVHVVEVLSRSVTLAWAPPFDGNSPLVHYIVRYWRMVKGSRMHETNSRVKNDQSKATIKVLAIIPSFDSSDKNKISIQI